MLKVTASLFRKTYYAPVAQLDRVAVSEAVGRWFESSQVRHFVLHLGLPAIPHSYMAFDFAQRNALQTLISPSQVRHFVLHLGLPAISHSYMAFDFAQRNALQTLISPSQVRHFVFLIPTHQKIICACKANASTQNLERL